MSLTIVGYNKVSGTVYRVDKKYKNYEPSIKDGKKIKIEGKRYEVIRVENNTDNGMQAMAVAPVNNGQVDTSEIVIAYPA
ncbi:hypothetical protein [Paraliobacillus sp. JSM ZJ581]|uniref:hypothetical protein n=1 Tax=Paraliobacillus sp. JSM ZJ581 TaxID=3342118 RepID=UPI0035A907D6